MKNTNLLNSQITIFCLDSWNVSGLDFFLKYEDKNYFLFRQRFRSSTYRFFRNGVTIEKAMKFRKAHGDRNVIHVMERLPSAIHYLETIQKIPLRDKNILDERSDSNEKLCSNAAA
ncbi:MAG: hypothetical protein IJ642_01785 [Oscillospiraceae bacterium]|nr:hypothetical protein [Oscillospiraceae bacterium]